MSNTNMWQDYQLAFNLLYKDGETSFEERYHSQNYFDQEQQIIKKDSFQKLSKEAREVVSIILDSTGELLSILKSESYDKISKNKLRSYLRLNKKWRKKEVNVVFDELKKFVGSF